VLDIPYLQGFTVEGCVKGQKHIEQVNEDINLSLFSFILKFTNY